MMGKRLLAMVAAVALGAGVEARAGYISFSFDGLATGTGTPITLSSGGVSATFTASGDPGGFSITPSIFSFPGNVLSTPSTSGQDYEALVITFSMPMELFGGYVASNGPGPFSVLGYNGFGVDGGATSENGMVDGLFEAPFGFNPAPAFGGADTVVLADSNKSTFALGSFFVVTANTIPECSTWAMMLLGFAGLGWAGYHRARAGGARRSPCSLGLKARVQL